MKKILISLFAFFCGIAVLHAEDKRPETGPIVDAFQGPKSEQVWIGRIGPKSANEVIVQITGVDHELNKKILKCTVEDGVGSREKRYATQINGQRYVLLILQNETGGELFLPQEKNSVHVYYNKNLSAQGNPEAFLTDYLEQEKNAKKK